MEVEEIKRRGYFDSVVINGLINPLYLVDGLKLHQDDSVDKLLDDQLESLHIEHLHLEISGKTAIDDNTAIKNANNLKLNITKTKTGLKYLIGYCNIIIIRNVKNSNYEKLFNCIQQMSSFPDKNDVYNTAFKIVDQCKNGEIDTISIIDRVYVNKHFRRCGISTWLHNNITSIIENFTFTKPDLIIMSYGDFAIEANVNFKMTASQYRKMLYKHYCKLGYKSTNTLQFITPSNNIVYKIIK